MVLKKHKTNRMLDELGRVVIPKELRIRCGLNPGDPVDFFLDGESIILRRHHMACVFCGTKEQVDVILGRTVCLHCLEQIRKG